MRDLRTIVLMLAVWGAAGSAAAQVREAPQSRDSDWGLIVGTGALAAPAYEGDDAYRLSILPNIQVTYGERFSASVQDGARYRWIDAPAFRAGPVGRIRFSRDEDGDQPFAITGEDTDDLRGLGDVDTSVELGAFVERDIGPVTLSLEARKAVSGHDGAVADIEARWKGRSTLGSAPFIWSIGPRLRVVDGSFETAYFGVNPAQSAASGLPVYEAGAGLHSYGLGASAVIPFTRDGRWAAVLFAGYDRLSGDAASSPLVEQRGSPDQASAGLFLSYRMY